MTIFSIGHSTHEPQEFVALARGLDVIVDVRSHPTSRWEQWRLENMREWLPDAGIEVVWLPLLGGWTKEHLAEYGEAMERQGVDLKAYATGAFPKQRIGADRPVLPGEDVAQPAWTNQGLYDYAWYTATREFHRGLETLIQQWGRPGQPKAAIMCCEALWWKCHRSMIADALWTIHRIDTLHIKSRLPKRATTKRWDNHSTILQMSNRIERYPRQVREAWGLDT